MPVARLRHSIALLTTAALLASLTAATVATPASAAKPKCRGQVATIVGTKKADRLVGTNRRDVIVARGGNDIVIGRGGNDLICGGPGADRLVGRDGIDRLYGNGGPDRLFGGDGPDRLYGGVGNDLVAGQVGPDLLNGGPGTDTCYQGQGAGPEVSCELPAAAPPPPAPPAPTPTPDPGPDLMSLDGILAVAYSDIDGRDGYSTGDVLIARLMDTNGDKVPSEGDKIQMGMYPLDLDASAFGDWAVSIHTLTSGYTIGHQTVTQSSAGLHQWFTAPYESFLEWDEDSSYAQFDDADDGFHGDILRVDADSPSLPQQVATPGERPNNAIDHAFVDVVINDTP